MSYEQISIRYILRFYTQNVSPKESCLKGAAVVIE